MYLQARNSLCLPWVPQEEKALKSQAGRARGEKWPRTL